MQGGGKKSVFEMAQRACGNRRSAIRTGSSKLQLVREEAGKLGLGQLETMAEEIVSELLGTEIACLIQDNDAAFDPTRNWLYIRKSGRSCAVCLDYGTETLSRRERLLTQIQLILNLEKNCSTTNDWQFVDGAEAPEFQREYKVSLLAKEELPQVAIFAAAEAEEAISQHPCRSKLNAILLDRYRSRIDLKGEAYLLSCPESLAAIDPSTINFFLSGAQLPSKISVSLSPIFIGEEDKMSKAANYIMEVISEERTPLSSDGDQPLVVSLCLGQLELSLTELLAIRPGSKIELGLPTEMPVRFCLGEIPFAQGRLQVSKAGSWAVVENLCLSDPQQVAVIEGKKTRKLSKNDRD